MAHFRIHNKGTLWIHDEAPAASTITPGMVCEMTSSKTVQAHSTEGGRAERLVALEDALQGNGVDTDYSADDIVTLAIPMPGEVFNLLVAAGQALNPGDEVVSGGDGTVIAASDVSTGVTVAQVIGRIDASEDAFTALASNTLKAVRLV
jgi:hypothetical protein